jgi:hypothetical protein
MLIHRHNIVDVYILLKLKMGLIISTIRDYGFQHQFQKIFLTLTPITFLRKDYKVVISNFISFSKLREMTILQQCGMIRVTALVNQIFKVKFGPSKGPDKIFDDKNTV